MPQRHTIVRPLGRDMVCRLLIQSLIHVLPQSAVICVICCYIRPRYDATQLYIPRDFEDLLALSKLRLRGILNLHLVCPLLLRKLTRD